MADDSHSSASEKSGYKKIIATCQLARSKGIEYAWVDTCCVDKTSSSELNEAINSMYRWYWTAEVCFALLTDFDNDITLEAALPKCRWFTRGWCLQELIAPKILEWYDVGWRCIGVKADLTTSVSRITSIDESVLLDRNLIASVPVGRRMSWAAKRKTTRQEDLAYCLLGIFDVNMPMLYGEGPRAFIRLQEEIIKSTNDLSIFAFDSGPRADTDEPLARDMPDVYCHLFAKSPEDFAGCAGLVGTGSDFHWNDAFSLTNRGLHFPRAKLRVDPRRGSYILPLNCRLSESAAVAHMCLRKVGPWLFSKYLETTHQQSLDVTREAHVEIEEAYIIASISATTQLQLQWAGEYAIRISREGYDLSRALQVFRRVPSSNRWDAARTQLLTRGEKNVQGFWKVFPGLAFPIAAAGEVSRSRSTTPCLLMCGIEFHQNVSSPRTWVRLCSLNEWRDLEAKFGVSMTQGNDPASPLDTRKTIDHITVDATSQNPLTITATIWHEDGEEIPYFRLELTFDSARADGV